MDEIINNEQSANSFLKEFYDENYNSVDLPNSTYILVIKKES